MAKLTFITKALASQPKPKSTVPTMKKMTKAVEAMGKHVGGYEVRPDGAVRILIAEDAALTADASDWWEKKVLDNGSA